MPGQPGSEAWFVLLTCHPKVVGELGWGGGTQLWEPGLLKRPHQSAVLLLEPLAALSKWVLTGPLLAHLQSLGRVMLLGSHWLKPLHPHFPFTGVPVPPNS